MKQVVSEKELNRVRYSLLDLQLMAEIGGFDLEEVDRKIAAAKKAARKEHDEAIEDAEDLERQAKVKRNVADNAQKRESKLDLLLQRLAL